MASLLRTSGLLAPASRACPQRAAFSAVKPVFAPLRPVLAERGTLLVMAAEKKDEKKKKQESPVKRAELAVERRMYNKSHKTACATRIKRVLAMAEQLVANPIKAEDEVKALEKLISEAYTEIDKAVVKGVLHQNTGARKKARCARWKRAVLMAGGFFKPAEDHPDFAKYQRMLAKSS